MKKKILIVDDQITNHYILRSLVEDTHFGISKYIETEMHGAFSGKECLSYLGKVHPLPDLILLDIDMPYITGFQVIQIIRKHKKFKKLKIIALTGSTDNNIKNKCLTLGFNHFISKPYNAIKMILFLKKILLNKK